MREIILLLLIAAFFGYVLIAEMRPYMATLLTLILLCCTMLEKLHSRVAEMERASEEHEEADREMEDYQRISSLVKAIERHLMNRKKAGEVAMDGEQMEERVKRLEDNKTEDRG
jgi:hypothetical protein